MGKNEEIRKPTFNQTTDNIERRRWILNQLRKGKLPKRVIDEVQERYSLAPSTAYNVVYECNAELNKSLKDLSDDAANYLLKTLQGIVEDSLEEKDRKSALKSLELISKITKSNDESPKIDINFGFNFTDEGK